MRLRYALVVVACYLTLPAFGASADGGLEGVVRAVGSAMNAETMLAPSKANKGPVLCPSALEKRIRHLGGSTVKAQGSWKLNSKGEQKCFEATDFTVTLTSSGRPAIVGKLTKKDGVYQLTEDGGRVMSLAEAPGGLRRMDGQRVILDLKPMSGPEAKDVTYKVVTYAAFP